MTNRSFCFIRILTLFLSLSIIQKGDLQADSPSHKTHYWFNDPQFQAILDDHTHTKAHKGNRVTLLIDGAASFQLRKENTATADVILIKTFEFWDDETGREIVQWLIERAQKGAKVFIQFDIKGYYDDYKDLLAIQEGKKDPIPPHLKKLIEEGKGNVFVTPVNFPVRYFETIKGLRIPRDHEKYYITWKYQNEVGPVKTIMGDMNIGNMYAFGGRKDLLEKEPPRKHSQMGTLSTDIEVIGTAVQEIVDEYIYAEEYHSHNENSTFQQKYAPLAQQAIAELKKMRELMQQNSSRAFPQNIGSAFVRFVTDPPHHANDIRNINTLLFLLFEYCPLGETIRITSAAFLPTPLMEKAIFSAAKRGVSFKFLLNTPHTKDPDLALVAAAARCSYRNFLTSPFKNSFAFYDWQGDSANNIGMTIHEKIFTFGQEAQAPFAIGSYNLDAHSSHWNSEDLLLIQSPELKRQLDEMLDKDFSHSTKISLEQLENEHVTDKFYQCFLNWFFNPLL